MLPALHTLDGRTVSGAEKQDATRCVAQTQSLLELMLGNACTVHKLVRLREHVSVLPRADIGRRVPQGTDGERATSPTCGIRCGLTASQMYPQESSSGATDCRRCASG